MDFAFNLQMQEAITASHILSPPHPYQPPSSTAPPPITEESHHITDIMLREIEMYEQERRDFEQCKVEMRKLKQNLSIQLHDQKFASEILRISEREWEKYGDNFEQPYCLPSPSSSSSSSSLSSLSSSFDSSRGDKLLGNECFRMYFKGIVDENYAKKKVAAIGVAICDVRDNMLFEVSKPLSEVEEREIDGLRVEFEALVAGLDVALTSELKRVEYFCDNFIFYEYVIGRRQPTEDRIRKLMERVNLLTKRFVRCIPCLVAQSDVKFAFRLARTSIFSQLIKLATCSSQKNVKEACSICYEDRIAELMFSVDGCGHRYCSLCMEKHMEAKLLDGRLPKCPHEGCLSGINIDRCQKILPPKLLDIMNQRVKEATIAASEKVYCPNPTCSTLMSMREVEEYSSTVVVQREELGSSRCIKCHELFCLDCKVPWHTYMTCFEYHYFQSNSDNPDTKLKSLASRKRWSQCQECKSMVELAEGCYHITCRWCPFFQPCPVCAHSFNPVQFVPLRCGYEFCYICRAEWKNKKPTCNCRLWDEWNLIRNQPNRNGRRN